MKPSNAERLPILVVDDDSALIRTLSDILKVHGYAPETAGTALDGLRMAERRPPALAVVDLRLPDMDGMELVARLRELSEMTEVVVLTGNASVESAIAALREHSVDYLLKPVQVEHLLQVVSVASERWQRRHMEQALLASEERYRMLFDSNPQPVWVFDRESLRFLAVNDAAVRHYGYTRDEFLAMTVLDIRTPEEGERFLKQSGGQPPFDDAPWTHRRKDGTRIDVSIRTHDIQFADRPARMVLALDITDQLGAERALVARARQQAAVASFGQRALVADDMAVLFQDATDLVAATLDVPIAAVLQRGTAGAGTLVAGCGVRRADAGSTEHDLRREHGVVAALGVEIPALASAKGSLVAYDTAPREFTQDDTYFLQAIAHIVATAVDRDRAESGLRQAQRLEAVGRLAGGVAHDFNNMLTAITGYGELLRSELAPGTSARDDVEEILKAAGRAAGLTKQLLAFSRQQVLQPRLVNLSEIVTGMEGMVRRLISADIAFTTALDPALGMVKADPGQLEQVILNLCVNARDAMPDGGVLTVETAHGELESSRPTEEATGAPGRYVMLAVTDTGVGMDADTIARVYEPFFTTKPADRGTGLGLPTVYGIVKQSGGEIFVYSEVGQGTTFKVYLPLAPDRAGSAHEDVPWTPREAVGTETVLLAEDEEGVRRLAQRVLEKAGYRVLVASSGVEAQGISDTHPGPIHLLATDMIMPTINGHELAERLRTTRPQMRVLYLSGYTSATVTRKGLLDRGATFLQKPFTGESLARKVRETLDGATQGGVR
ncbi:MAG: response regulator [Gemmatimonadaceae bacterium]